MIDRLKVMWAVSLHETGRHLASQRMLLLAPLILFFLGAACWGFSDPRFIPPADITVDGPAGALFLASVVTVLVCTLAVVLVGFDAISRRRLTGELAIDLSQPMPRSDFAVTQLLGVWMAVMLPTLVGILIGVALIHEQMGAWPSALDLAVFILATGLLLWWYTCLQLLASSMARDLGSAVTFGVGTWMLFTLLWVMVTAVVAAFNGVAVTDMTSPSWDALSEQLDLLSPNGVYQLLLETRLAEDSQPQIAAGWIWFAALVWAGLPKFLFIWRMHRIKP